MAATKKIRVDRTFSTDNATDATARNLLSVSTGAPGFNALTGVISIPNNTSQLINGAGFITSSSLSVSTASASGSGSLSYSGGVFTFTPPAAYSLPTASTSTLGGVKVDGSTITISNGIISASGGTSLPSQFGNGGKYLTTDGSTLSWGTVAGGGGSSGTTTNALTIGNGLTTSNELSQILYSPVVENTYFGGKVSTNGTYTVVAGGGSAFYAYVFSNATGKCLYKIQMTNFYLNGAVCINSNNIIAIGDNWSTAGRVCLFDMSTWTAYSGSTITITSATSTISNPVAAPTGAGFGSAIAMSTTRLVVGAQGNNSQAGAVYIYTLADNTLRWTITNPNAYSSNGTGDFFGCSVAISGNMVVMGAYIEGDSYNNSNGKAYKIDLANFAPQGSTVSSSNWSSYGVTINRPNPNNAAAYFGFSVATNGIYIAVGAPWIGGNVPPTSGGKQQVGAVYVFNTLDNNALLYTIYSPAPFINGGQWFGGSISISGTQLLVGESFSDSNDTPGAAHLYDLNTGTLIKTIYSPNPIGAEGNYQRDSFGGAVSLSGTSAAIGAPGELSSGGGSGWQNQGGGMVVLYNFSSLAFNGNTATTIGLSQTSVIPGLYGSYNNSNNYVELPTLQVDEYGRVVAVTKNGFTLPSAGMADAYTQIYVNGSPSMMASGSDYVNFAAGSNVTLTSNSGSRTITISSTGGGGSSGGGSNVPPFVTKMGPSSVAYTNGDATFTMPVTGKLLVQPMSFNESIMSVGGPGLGPFNQLTNAPYYGPSGQQYPWYSSQSIASGTTVHVSTNYANGGSGSMDILGWVLDSTTDPSTMACYNGGAGLYSPDGNFSMFNAPQQYGNQYWSTTNYFYGILYLQGGGGGYDMNNFQAAAGVTAYYDSMAGFTFIKVPASFWNNSIGNPPIGSLAGFTGSYGVNGYYFGNY